MLQAYLKVPQQSNLDHCGVFVPMSVTRMTVGNMGLDHITSKRACESYLSLNCLWSNDCHINLDLMEMRLSLSSIAVLLPIVWKI